MLFCEHNADNALSIRPSKRKVYSNEFFAGLLVSNVVSCRVVGTRKYINNRAKFIDFEIVFGLISSGMLRPKDHEIF